MKYLVLSADGTAELRECEQGKGYDSFKEALNGGWLELIPVGRNFVCYVDEDGISKRLPRNERATKIVVKMLDKLGRVLIAGDFIKGNAIFVGSSETGEEDVDLPDSVVQEYFPELVN